MRNNGGPGLDRARRKAFFEKAILASAPRILSAMDRCPVSSQRGSMDREYWGWATKDFSNIDLQRASRLLAHVYSIQFEGNLYFKQKAVLDWALYGIEYWIRRQSPSGAFDHLYVKEESWMVTAFTIVDMVAVFRLLDAELSSDLKEKFLLALRRGCNLLLARDETHGFISNHRAGAAAALMGLFRICGEEKYRDGAWRIMNEVYDRQSAEGWFLEYEGADPGYQTLDMHYQAVFFQECAGDKRILNAVEKAMHYQAYFLHPDGSIGGEYGSRNCPHFFPGGFEVFARHIPMAESMARMGCYGLAQGSSCGTTDADIRNEVPLLTSYLLAHQTLTAANEEFPHDQLPFEREFEIAWPESGIYIRSDKRNYLVFGASKGGVVKLFSKEIPGLLHSSCGYVATLADGRMISNHFWRTSPNANFDGIPPREEIPLRERCAVGVEAPFYYFQPDRTMKPLHFILFRVFNNTLGRVEALNSFLRKEIIGRFVTRRQGIAFTLKRSLVIEGGAIKVKDAFSNTANAGIADLTEHGFISTIYMASARYFRLQDLRHAWSRALDPALMAHPAFSSEKDISR